MEGFGSYILSRIKINKIWELFKIIVRIPPMETLTMKKLSVEVVVYWKLWSLNKVIWTNGKIDVATTKKHYEHLN
jgi:hypothetical protein